MWCRPWAVACLVDYVLGLPGPHCPRLAVRFSRGPSSAQRHESFSGFSSVQWLRQIVPWLCWSPCDLESWDCLSRYYVLRLLAPGLGCWACQWLSDEISDETHETHSRRTGHSERPVPSSGPGHAALGQAVAVLRESPLRSSSLVGLFAIFGPRPPPLLSAPDNPAGQTRFQPNGGSLRRPGALTSGWSWPLALQLFARVSLGSSYNSHHVLWS